MSALLAPAKPHRIKATHRRRRRIASGRFVQRYYDPELGRFLIPDPVGPEEDFVNHFNRYVYAYNNPVRYTDPDGRAPAGCGSGTCNQYHKSRPEVRKLRQDFKDGKMNGGDSKLRMAADSLAGVIKEKVSVVATGTAALGSGVQAEKALTSNTKDRVGLVTPGVGLEAKMDVSVKLFSINFSDSKFDSPFGMQAELSLHAGFGGTIQLDFDPGGTLDVSLGLGGGVGGQATYQIYVEPTVSNDIKK